MPTTFYIADASNTATKLFDLVDSLGTFNPGGLKTKLLGLDAGRYTPEMGLFDPDTAPGSIRTRRRAPSVQMNIGLRTIASNYDNQRLGLERLFALLETPRIMVYQGDGSSERRYITTIGADVEQLLRGGQENWDQVVRQFSDTGMDLAVLRQPIIYGDTLTSATNKAANPLLLFDQDGTNGATTGRPDGWTWRTTAGAVDATGISAESCGGTADGYTFTLAAGTTKDLTIEALPAVAGQIWSGQFVFVGAAGITARAAIQGMLAAALLGAETLGVAGIGTNAEQRVTVVSAGLPATTDRVRIKLRIQNTTGGALAVTLRRAQLELAGAPTRFVAGTETIPNDPATTRGRILALWNDGPVRAPAILTSTIDAAATPAVAQMVVGKRGNGGVAGLRRLGDYANSTKYAQAEASERGWTVAPFGTDTTAPANDADASGTGNNYARCTHATNPTVLRRRVRITRTTLIDSLRGAFQVVARVRPAVSQAHTIQLKWAPSLDDPASNTNTAVTLDTAAQGGAPPVNGFVELDLGAIYIPTTGTVAGLALEVWTSAAAAGNLDIDQLWLIPAEIAYEDAIGRLFLPGSAADKVLGKNLASPMYRVNPPDPVWIAGTNQGSSKRLNATNESAAWGLPVTGTVLGVGRHRFTFAMNDQIKGNHTARIQIANVTDNALVAGTVLTYTGTVKNTVPRTVRLEFDGVAGKGYQAQIGLTNYAGPATGNLDVQAITYEFVAAISSGQSLRSDPTTRYTAERLDAAGAIQGILDAAGELPVTLDPGLNLIAVRHDEVPLQLYAERQNKKARIPTMGHTYAPGYYTL